MSRQPSRAWRAFTIVARILVFSGLGALLFFALGLLLGILGIAIYNSAARANADMANAYRVVAVSTGVVGMVATLIGMIVNEVRESRRAQ